jgi:hypothetical protein
MPAVEDHEVVRGSLAGAGAPPLRPSSARPVWHPLSHDGLLCRHPCHGRARQPRVVVGARSEVGLPQRSGAGSFLGGASGGRRPQPGAGSRPREIRTSEEAPRFARVRVRATASLRGHACACPLVKMTSFLEEHLRPADGGWNDVPRGWVLGHARRLDTLYGHLVWQAQVDRVASFTPAIQHRSRRLNTRANAYVSGCRFPTCPRSPRLSG